MPEMLMVVAVIGILAAVGITLMSPARKDLEAVKLRNDVESLNKSIQVYRASGGSLAGVATADAVLTKLKMSGDAHSSATVVGCLSGELADPRIDVQMMTSSEAAGDTPRAVWNGTRQRFEFATAGDVAVKRFFMNDAIVAPPSEEVRETRLSYAASDNWVWDYTDHSLASNTGVAPLTTAAGGTTTYIPIPTANATPLSPPSFSVEPGLYNYYDFGLAVELFDPNPAGTAVIYYSLDGALWEPYNGGDIMVGADQTLTAYSVSLDPDSFSDSTFNDAHYGSTFTIAGSATGNFTNPEGGENLVSNLGDGDSDNYFSFGVSANELDPSWLLFNGADFADVNPDESFLLGTLDYFNGTIFSSTGAVGVGLSIDLDFAGTEVALDFNYDFGLINTPNLEGNTPEESADYVQLQDIYSDVSVEIAGNSYQLILEFGETTEGGFSSVDQFHVIEGATASGSLYGRLVEADEEGEEG